MAKKIAVAFNKGGVTKTTSVVNLAGALSKEYPNSKILIVETDGQGNATRSFGKDARKYEKTSYDIFMNNFSAKETIIQAYGNIDIIPANDALNYVEFDSQQKTNEHMIAKFYKFIQSYKNSMVALFKLNKSEFIEQLNVATNPADNYFNMLKNKFNDLDKEYDVIFFDTPPELKAITSSVLAISDSVIIPFEPDTYSVDGLISIIKRINTIKTSFNANLEIAGILAAKVQNNTKLHADVRNSVMKYCMKNNIRYFQNEIPRSIRFASSTSYKGLPATLTLKDNQFSDSYFGLLHELYENKIIDETLLK